MNSLLLSVLCANAAWADAPPACPAPCAAKVCVPVPTMRTTDKVVFDDRCVDYCLPRCSLFSLFWGGGCGCDRSCANCGRPRTRHVLIKKIVHEECPDVKCEVREAPCVRGP
jgi:hypothetical protein